MNAGTCAHCGEPLDRYARADRRTCSMRCHVAAWRARRRANGPALVHDPTGGIASTSTPNVAVTPPSTSEAA